MENKAEEIREAKEAADEEVNEGTLRGSYTKAALRRELESEFHENLTMAWTSAVKASEIDSTGSLDLDDVVVTPRIVFAGVCSLHGDLRLALEKWDEAVGFYNQALQHIPGEPMFYYNIGVAYTNKHDPALAIAAFQKVVELDPAGDQGVEATKNIQRLSSGSLGRKGFAGSWKVVAVLGGLTLLSLFMIGQVPGAGLMNLIMWGGILALYWWRKYK